MDCMPNSGSSPQTEPSEACVEAPFGAVCVVSRGERLVGIAFLPLATHLQEPADPLAREACRQIAAYLRDPRFRFELPLEVRGSAHQQRVWKAIAAIPAGTTRSYGEIARDIGSSPRAVGAACGANPFPLVVPCHRVVAASGATGGFMNASAGFPLGVKRWLLDHERR